MFNSSVGGMFIKKKTKKIEKIEKIQKNNLLVFVFYGNNISTKSYLLPW